MQACYLKEVKPMIKKTVFLFCFLISCTHTEKPPNSLSFSADRETVWKVLVTVFKAYPLKTIDETLGYIETKTIKSPNFWTAPHQKKTDFSGYSYFLKVNLNYDKPISTVLINKKVYKQKGFISNKKEIYSDHLEETALLYQIARELEVQNLLKQSNK